jgi:hypothetical protein
VAAVDGPVQLRVVPAGPHDQQRWQRRVRPQVGQRPIAEGGAADPSSRGGHPRVSEAQGAGHVSGLRVEPGPIGIGRRWERRETDPRAEPSLAGCAVAIMAGEEVGHQAGRPAGGAACTGVT